MLLSLLALGVAAFLLWAVKVWLEDYLWCRRHGIPFFAGLPVVGGLLRVLRLFNTDIYTEAIKRMEEIDEGKGLVGMKRFFTQPLTIMVSNPQIVRHMLVDNFENYHKGPDMRESLYPLLGTGIFNANGATWQEQRKTASHLFKVKELKVMVDVFTAHLPRLFHLLDSGEEQEMQALFSAYTLDCFGQIAYGLHIGALEDPLAPFSRAFNEAQKASLWRFIFFPLWKLGFGENERSLHRSVKMLDDICYPLIAERQSDPQLAQRTDLLSRYVQLQQEPGSTITTRYIRDILMNFLLAGRDTTAQSIMWACYLLALPENVEALSKARKEVANADLSYDSMKSGLPYLRNVCYETLRLYPPVPTDPKTAIKDDVLPGGYPVKAGTVLQWNQNWMGRSTRFWGADALEFHPERHDKPETPALGTPPFIPFQMGPRVCLGQTQALLEMKCVLAALLQRYTWEISPNQEIIRYPNITISAKNGIKMRWKKTSVGV